MISRAGIRSLYKAKKPEDGYSVQFLNMICDKCNKYHKLEFKDGFMIIGSLDHCNPFKRIRLSCIKSIQDLGDEVAVVLSTCIIIFNNITGKISINIRSDKMNGGCPFLQKIASLFRRNK